MLKLEATLREKKENLNSLRAKGFMPAVFYGPKTPATSISIPHMAFIKAWKQAGESSVISIKTPAEEVLTLINDVDVDPLTDLPRHADFYVFQKGEKIKVKVPLEFTGESPAVKELGGVLIKVMHDLEVEAEPQNLPHGLTVDISSLAVFGSRIVAQDITLPTGVSLAVNPEDVIVSVSEPKEEVVEETPMDISDIEVEKKGKEVKEGEEGTAPAEPAPAEKK